MHEFELLSTVEVNKSTVSTMRVEALKLCAAVDDDDVIEQCRALTMWWNDHPSILSHLKKFILNL